MTDSDADIYAKVTGNDEQSITNDATPLSRDPAPGLIDKADISYLKPREGSWARCLVRDNNGQPGIVYLRPGEIQANQGHTGRLHIGPTNEAVFRAQPQFTLTTAPELIAVEMEDSGFVADAADRDRIQETDHAGAGYVNDNIPSASLFDDSETPDREAIDHDDDWFVAYDASGSRRSMGSHHCYETYFPQEALRFRDSRHSRPPVRIFNGQCISVGWDGPRHGDFGIISTACHRISADDVPAPDEQMDEIIDEVRAEHDLDTGDITETEFSVTE